MKTHELTQGTPEWHAYRLQHFNASDAPAMMGCSPYQSRTQLLHKLHTGMTADVDASTQRIFDAGHRFEALARPLAEEFIGESLYPVVGSEGELSASFDGITMDESTCFEHKTLNDELRASMRDEGNGYGLPQHYQIQMEQQLLVSGAERCLFMASKWEGEELVEERHCWYASDPKLRAQIIAGWKQFAQELASYLPPEIIVPAVAAPQMGLPAVSIQVNGSIALVDNLDKFGVALTAYVERINRKPETDQDFADLEATVKTLKAAEEALDAAESGALAQTESIDSMRKTVSLYRDTARTNRLLVEKLVKAEKENRRTSILSDAVAEFHTHITGLNTRLGKPYMPVIQADFQGVVKGLKSIDSMRDKVKTELARVKIEANAAADKIQANLTTLRELAKDHVFLFADTPAIVLKANDDLTALVKSRIADHAAAEAAKEEATRARIQAEEQAKAEKAAREKLVREQAEATEAAQAAKVESERIVREQMVQAPITKIVAVLEDADSDPVMLVERAPVATVIPFTAPRPATAPSTPPSLKLGDICARLAPITVTGAGLSQLGFEPAAIDRASRLYHDHDFALMCAAMVKHIEQVQAQQAA